MIFFFASAAASAGYLTVSEVFPMEIRAMAIAVFYAIATALGGISGPVIFGNLIGTGNVTNLFIAYLLSAGLMIFAALVEVFLGVRAEGQSLENVARPLTAIEEGTGTSAAARRDAERSITAPPARSFVSVCYTSEPMKPLADEVQALVARVGTHPVWGYAHCLRVHALAEELARAERLSYDAEILRIAALLHDVGLYKAYAFAKLPTTPGARRTSQGGS